MVNKVHSMLKRLNLFLMEAHIWVIDEPQHCGKLYLGILTSFLSCYLYMLLSPRHERKVPQIYSQSTRLFQKSFEVQNIEVYYKNTLISWVLPEYKWWRNQHGCPVQSLHVTQQLAESHRMAFPRRSLVMRTITIF